MHSKKNLAYLAGGLNSASYSTPPQYYDYYTVNTAPYAYNYGDVSNTHRTGYDELTVTTNQTGPVYNQPTTNYTNSNVNNYKPTSKLPLPEYDYNASPEDIIHNSNANFDYERYINDWVRPYSNSNMYIRKNANDQNGVKAYTTRENFGSLHEYYDLTPPPVNQTTTYVQPMPTTVVAPSSTTAIVQPTVEPAKKITSAKAVSPTLEYLDLGIKNVLASIGAQPSANGRIVVQDAVVTTPAAASVLPTTSANNNVPPVPPSIFYYPVKRDYVEIAPVKQNYVDINPGQITIIDNNNFNLDAVIGSDYEIIDYNQYINMLQNNTMPTMPVLTTFNQPEQDGKSAVAVPYFEQPPKKAPELVPQTPAIPPTSSEQVKQLPTPLGEDRIENVPPKQPPQLIDASKFPTEDELKQSLIREVKKRPPAVQPPATYEPVVVPSTYEPAIAAYPPVQYIDPHELESGKSSVIDYAPSQPASFYNNGRVPYTVKTIQRSEPILYDPLNPNETQLINQSKVSPPSGAHMDKVLKTIEDINFKPIGDEELQLLLQGATVKKPEPVQPVKPTAQPAQPGQKAPTDDLKQTPVRQDSVPASSSSTPGKDTKTSPKEDKKETENIQPKPQPQERIVDVKLVPTAEQSVGARLAQTLAPKEPSSAIENRQKPAVEEKPIALKRQESAKNKQESVEADSTTSKSTVKTQPSVDSIETTSDVKLPKQNSVEPAAKDDSETELENDAQSPKQKKNSISKLIKAFEEKRDTTASPSTPNSLRRNSSSNWNNNNNTASTASLADESTGISRFSRLKSSDAEPATSRQNSNVSTESAPRRGSSGGIESPKVKVEKTASTPLASPDLADSKPSSSDKSTTPAVKKSEHEEKSIPTRRIESELVNNPTDSVKSDRNSSSGSKEPTSPTTASHESKLPRRKSTDTSAQSGKNESPSSSISSKLGEILIGIPRRSSVDHQTTTTTTKVVESPPRRKSSIEESAESPNKISNLIKRFESTEDDAEASQTSKSPKVLEELEQIEKKPSKLRNLKYRGGGDDDDDGDGPIVDVKESTAPPDVLSGSRIPTRSNAVRAKQSKYRSADIISELKDDIKNAELKMQQKMKNAKSDSDIIDKNKLKFESDNKKSIDVDSNDNDNDNQNDEENSNSNSNSTSTDEESNNKNTTTTSTTTATSYMSVKPKGPITATVSSKINATTTTTTSTNGSAPAADSGSVSSFSITSKAQVTDKQNIPQSKVELKRKSDKPI